MLVPELAVVEQELLRVLVAQAGAVELFGTETKGPQIREVEEMIEGGIARVLSMQLPGGGFRYWAGGDREHPWGTAYALDTLLEAAKQLRRIAEESEDIDAAVQAQQLGYEEQALAFALQGLANKRSAGRPTRMFKAGFLDFDWPDADGWWRGELEAAGRVSYTNLTSTLCGLVEGASARRGEAGYGLCNPGSAADVLTARIASPVGATR